MTETEKLVRESLLSMKDDEYKNFHSKLIPTVNPDKIIGIRVPVLRKFSAEIWKNGTGELFIKNLPHKYYEEDNVHAFCIEKITDIDTAITETERFLPYIDNWATCDMFSPKVFAKHADIIYEKSLEWIKSDHVYTVRYGIGMLMRYFLDENFSEDVLKIVSEIRSEEYYVNMMIAWFFATALSKQYDEAVKIIENEVLPIWVHNKTIQKAIESRVVTVEHKEHLKNLRR